MSITRAEVVGQHALTRQLAVLGKKVLQMKEGMEGEVQEYQQVLADLYAAKDLVTRNQKDWENKSRAIRKRMNRNEKGITARLDAIETERAALAKKTELLNWWIGRDREVWEGEGGRAAKVRKYYETGLNEIEMEEEALRRAMEWERKDRQRRQAAQAKLDKLRKAAGLKPGDEGSEMVEKELEWMAERWSLPQGVEGYRELAVKKLTQMGVNDSSKADLDEILRTEATRDVKLTPAQKIIHALLHPVTNVDRMLVAWETGTGKSFVMISGMEHYFRDPRPKIIISPNKVAHAQFVRKIRDSKNLYSTWVLETCNRAWGTAYTFDDMASNDDSFSVHQFSEYLRFNIPKKDPAAGGRRAGTMLKQLVAERNVPKGPFKEDMWNNPTAIGKYRMPMAGPLIIAEMKELGSVAALGSAAAAPSASTSIWAHYAPWQTKGGIIFIDEVQSLLKPPDVAERQKIMCQKMGQELTKINDSDAEHRRRYVMVGLTATPFTEDVTELDALGRMLIRGDFEDKHWAMGYVSFHTGDATGRAGNTFPTVIPPYANKTINTVYPKIIPVDFDEAYIRNMVDRLRKSSRLKPPRGSLVTIATGEDEVDLEGKVPYDGNRRSRSSAVRREEERALVGMGHARSDDDDVENASTEAVVIRPSKRKPMPGIKWYDPMPISPTSLFSKKQVEGPRDLNPYLPLTTRQSLAKKFGNVYLDPEDRPPMTGAALARARKNMSFAEVLDQRNRLYAVMRDTDSSSLLPLQLYPNSSHSGNTWWDLSDAEIKAAVSPKWKVMVDDILRKNAKTAIMCHRRAGLYLLFRYLWARRDEWRATHPEGEWGEWVGMLIPTAKPGENIPRSIEFIDNPAKPWVAWAHKTIDAFNSPENARGKQCQIILLDAKVHSESLTLKGVRLLVHASVPQDFSKLLQVNGRINRFRSHDQLPTEERKVEYMLYISPGGPDHAQWNRIAQQGRPLLKRMRRLQLQSIDFAMMYPDQFVDIVGPVEDLLGPEYNKEITEDALGEGNTAGDGLRFHVDFTKYKPHNQTGLWAWMERGLQRAAREARRVWTKSMIWAAQYVAEWKWSKMEKALKEMEPNSKVHAILEIERMKFQNLQGIFEQRIAMLEPRVRTMRQRREQKIKEMEETMAALQAVQDEADKKWDDMKKAMRRRIPGIQLTARLWKNYRQYMEEDEIQMCIDRLGVIVRDVDDRDSDDEGDHALFV